MSTEVATPQSAVSQDSKESKKNGNGKGIAGFVLSIISLFLCLIPGLGFVLWILGLIFSTLDLQKSKKGLAVAGFVISLIIAILILLVHIGGSLALLEELETL